MFSAIFFFVIIFLLNTSSLHFSSARALDALPDVDPADAAALDRSVARGAGARGRDAGELSLRELGLGALDDADGSDADFKSAVLQVCA